MFWMCVAIDLVLALMALLQDHILTCLQGTFSFLCTPSMISNLQCLKALVLVRLSPFTSGPLTVMHLALAENSTGRSEERAW